ncbi:MAG: PaaI family thioesterase [Deltaproteobacteria bacterium]|nr:PaaI family thioesterase [Deltaproteobacteria bacterium]
MDFVASWIEESPYSRFLGVELAKRGEESLLLRLPYKDENSNPGKALHGGCAASLGAIGAQALARAALGPDTGTWHSVGLQVSYLAAAIGETILARARLLRRGKEICFAEVDIETEDAKPIAHVTAVVRARLGAPEASLPRSPGDHGRSEPGSMGPHIGAVPFIGNRGIRVEHMTGGTSRLVMPFLDTNADQDGTVHEGAVLALLDTTGAMASWAETGAGRYKASTPAIQAQILAPSGRGELVAFGRCVHRDRELLWSDVEIARRDDMAICARGTVIYRIVV